MGVSFVGFPAELAKEGSSFVILNDLLYPSDFSGNKKKIWAFIPSHLIGTTQHCTLGNREWSIVLMDESVPEQHDLIASLGERCRAERRGFENAPH